MEEAEDLDSDFNYNMVLAKSLIGNLPIPQERNRAIRWFKKLAASDTNQEELRLRNMFAYYLLLNIRDGNLRAPFDVEPSVAPLVTLQKLLPEGCADLEEESGADEGLDGAAAGHVPPMMYEQSPDGGAFLAAQPVPRCGAFCYLAVVARPES